MKKLYIITGANGFLGNNIIRKLEQNRESEIRALVLPNDSIKSLEKLNCKIYYGDVTKKKSLSSILALSYISKVLKKNLSLPLNATFIILCALGLLTVYLLLFLILSVSSLISSSMWLDSDIALCKFFTAGILGINPNDITIIIIDHFRPYALFFL